MIQNRKSKLFLSALSDLKYTLREMIKMRVWKKH